MPPCAMYLTYHVPVYMAAGSQVCVYMSIYIFVSIYTWLPIIRCILGHLGHRHRQVPAHTFEPPRPDSATSGNCRIVPTPIRPQGVLDPVFPIQVDASVQAALERRGPLFEKVLAAAPWYRGHIIRLMLVPPNRSRQIARFE
jgi:hypothetical protein